MNVAAKGLKSLKKKAQTGSSGGAANNAVVQIRRDRNLGGRLATTDAPVVSNVAAPVLRNAISSGPLKGVPGALNNLPLSTRQLPYTRGSIFEETIEFKAVFQGTNVQIAELKRP